MRYLGVVQSAEGSRVDERFARVAAPQRGWNRLRLGIETFHGAASTAETWDTCIRHSDDPSAARLCQGCDDGPIRSTQPHMVDDSVIAALENGTCGS